MIKVYNDNYVRGIEFFEFRYSESLVHASQRDEISY